MGKEKLKSIKQLLQEEEDLVEKLNSCKELSSTINLKAQIRLKRQEIATTLNPMTLFGVISE